MDGRCMVAASLPIDRSAADPNEEDDTWVFVPTQEIGFKLFLNCDAHLPTNVQQLMVLAQKKEPRPSIQKKDNGCHLQQNILIEPLCLLPFSCAS